MSREWFTLSFFHCIGLNFRRMMREFILRKIGCFKIFLSYDDVRTIESKQMCIKLFLDLIEQVILPFIKPAFIIILVKKKK